ncbi:cell division protein ZapA [Yoonia sp. 208BN28-4]|uniref:cell division protein ZapA n=1 Tax=Yoonia sp. 208BN28-4 TaxID=3126505 RepID=UPI0030B4D232
MPHVEITIGGRQFEVACQEGEEHYLHSAAAMLNTEAAHLSEQIGRMPEARMLLMAGLMLADKTAGLEEKVRVSDNKTAELQARIDALEGRPAPAPERVEVPVVPSEVTDTLAELAARAEALADSVETKTA